MSTAFNAPKTKWNDLVFTLHRALGSFRKHAGKNPQCCCSGGIGTQDLCLSRVHVAVTSSGNHKQKLKTIALGIRLFHQGKLLSLLYRKHVLSIFRLLHFSSKAFKLDKICKTRYFQSIFFWKAIFYYFFIYIFRQQWQD